MGNKFVTTDSNNIVLDPYDDRFKNVPDDAVPITSDEFELLSKEPCHHFHIVAGKLERRIDADDIKKNTIVGEIEKTEFMAAFVGLLIDEINILRQAAGKSPRTMAQFKTAMKNKLL